MTNTIKEHFIKFSTLSNHIEINNVDLKERVMHLNIHTTTEIIEKTDQDITYDLNVARKDTEEPAPI